MPVFLDELLITLLFIVNVSTIYFADLKNEYHTLEKNIARLIKQNNPGTASSVLKLALLCNEHCTYISL